MTEDEIVAGMEAEQKAYGGPITIRVNLGTLTAVIGLAQLALRHPNMQRDEAALVRKLAERFIERTIGHMELEGLPAHAEAVRRGNDPANDV